MISASPTDSIPGCFVSIESSGRAGSVALVMAGQIVESVDFPHDLKHASGMLPLIDRMLAARQIKPMQVQALLVSEGPGSFTGLRIGVTMAKAWSLITGAALVAVPTLAVLAMNAPADAEHLIVVLDAKRDQIFTARFSRQGEKWIEQEPAHLDRLEAMLQRSPRPVHLLGEGIPFHQKFIPVEDRQIIITPPTAWTARAEAVARLGMQLFAAGHRVAADQFAPRYIRLPEAEEKWLEAQKLTGQLK